MLPAKLRLDPKEIPTIAKRGKRYDHELFFIRSWYDDSLLNPQFAISVSLKVDKRAVVRNLIKRKFRAAIINLTKNENVRLGKYLIVIKNANLKAYKTDDVETKLRKIIAGRS